MQHTMRCTCRGKERDNRCATKPKHNNAVSVHALPHAHHRSGDPPKGGKDKTVQTPAPDEWRDSYCFQKRRGGCVYKKNNIREGFIIHHLEILRILDREPFSDRWPRRGRWGNPFLYTTSRERARMRTGKRDKDTSRKRIREGEHKSEGGLDRQRHERGNDE